MAKICFKMRNLFGTSWRITDCLKESRLDIIIVGIDCNGEGTKGTMERDKNKTINRGLSLDENRLRWGRRKIYRFHRRN